MLPNINDLRVSDPTVAAFAELLAADPELPVHACRDRLAQAKGQLDKRFRQGDPVESLVAAHAGLIDVVLVHLWRQLALTDIGISLIAVGGYGRGELHPGSDIDILLLLEDDAGTPEEPIAAFVAGLWDTGLEIGHSVRTVAECEAQALADVTVLTTLMESRLLIGAADRFDKLTVALGPERLWHSRDFFVAKRDEQERRHARYDDTGYNLEPNLKGSPGGLRDIQTISWVATRHFVTNDLHSLVDVGFLTPVQYQRLIDGRHYLWTLRYGLHLLTGRREDRLLFDHQKALAELLGYEDARYTLGVEQMMQRYYRTVMQLSRLNEMLLQLFEEDILLEKDSEPEDLGGPFMSRNGYLQIKSDDAFARDPSALLSLFVCMQENPSLKGVSAHTITLIRQHLHLIDEQFRQHPRNHRLFLTILRAESGVTRELRRMNRYGILGLYIPAFGRIVGRMQYDLFHAYTVDEHTLFVVANLRRFAIRLPDDEFLHCSRVMQALPDASLAYLAGLFHDIAKGRGGDHSELGAIDALAFCREHGLEEDDAQLVSWLVENHLVLSMTAQKKDITDPEVIAAFAKRIGNRQRLDYLYVLTAADVRGTNPKLWNSWKSKLFRDLYEATEQALSRGLQNPMKKGSLVEDTRQQALDALQARFSSTDIDHVWSVLPSDYFLRHSPMEIGWHTRQLIEHGLSRPLIHVTERDELNAVAIMIYTLHIRHTFAAATAALDALGLSVLDARIEPLSNEFSLDTYIVVQTEGQPFEPERLDEIRARLRFIVDREDDYTPEVTRKPERRQRMFDTPTRVKFRPDETAGRTIMELTCADYPGLLLTVGEILIECGIYINTAKIVTIGERAEDVFFLTNEEELPLKPAEQEALQDALLDALEAPVMETRSV